MVQEKFLTEEAQDFIYENDFEVFETPNEYITYIFRQTNLHDAVAMLEKLGRAIKDYTLSQDYLLFIANQDEIQLDIESHLNYLGFEGEVFGDGE